MCCAVSLVHHSFATSSYTVVADNDNDVPKRFTTVLPLKNQPRHIVDRRRASRDLRRHTEAFGCPISKE